MRSPLITSVVPLNKLQRRYEWKARLDAAIGLESETRHFMHAYGQETKKRWLEWMKQNGTKLPAHY